jgi:energy-coupling factor transporter ATP-binding protein EcfA2
MTLTINTNSRRVASNPASQNLTAQQTALSPAQFLEKVGQLNTNKKLPPTGQNNQGKNNKPTKEEPIKFDDINNIELLKDFLNQGNNGVEKILIENENASLQNISQASYKITVISKEKNMIGQSKTTSFYAGGLSSEEVKDLIVTAKQSKVTAQVITPGSDAPQRLLMNIGLVVGGLVLYKAWNIGAKRLKVENFRKRLNESIIKRPEDIIIELDSLKNIDWTDLGKVRNELHKELILDPQLTTIIDSTIQATNDLIAMKDKQNTTEFSLRFRQLVGYISGAPGCGKSTIVNALTKAVLHKLQEHNIPIAIINLESIGVELSQEGKGHFDVSSLMDLLPGNTNLSKAEKSALIAECIRIHGNGNAAFYGHDIGQRDGKGKEASLGISSLSKALLDGSSTKQKKQNLWGQFTSKLLGIPSKSEGCNLFLAIASNYDPSDNQLTLLVNEERAKQVEAIKDRFTFVKIGLPEKDLVNAWFKKPWPNLESSNIKLFNYLAEMAFMKGLSFRKLDILLAGSKVNGSYDVNRFKQALEQVDSLRYQKSGSSTDTSNSSSSGVDGMVRSGVRALVDEIKSSLPSSTANFSNNNDPDSIESKVKAILDQWLKNLQQPNSNEQN